MNEGEIGDLEPSMKHEPAEGVAMKAVQDQYHQETLQIFSPHQTCGAQASIASQVFQGLLRQANVWGPLL